jgi:DNA topoisomerase-1
MRPRHRIALLVTLLVGLQLGTAWAQKAKPAYRLQSPQASKAKFERVKRFQQKQLPTVRGLVARGLARPKADKATALAAIVRIMDTLFIRVGSERFAQRKKNPSFGASSLLKSQVAVEGDVVTFDFPGKSGVRWRRAVKDPKLAAAIKIFLETPGKRLFNPPEGAVTELDVRAFLEPFGAQPKDLRTMHANRLLEEELDHDGPPSMKHLKAAITRVAAQLGHTPTVSRQSYMNPVTLKRYTAEATAADKAAARSRGR